MKKAIHITILFVLSGFGAIAQNLDLQNSTTRALVVGISNYQDDDIPDLKYAHKDAETFAAFLQSPSGGNVPSENITLLLNEDATWGNVNMALWSWVEECVEGDEVIFYFSGHGDLESKLLNQLGYLLCHDSPSFAYMAGGTVRVGDLQGVVNTLTQVNKTKVLLITDACRAGQLAGNPINGTGATTANLQQFSNAVKILSCQPNEFSVEGEQWGGGRGAFSYHLVDGLYGLADRDKNFQVKLKEIDRYLEDRVPVETDPQPQNPIVLGDKETTLAFVDSTTLAALEERKKEELLTFSPVEAKGVLEKELANQDSSLLKQYDAFLSAIEQGHLMDPPKGQAADSSANHYYELLIQEPDIQHLHGLMTRNFVAALMDDAQKWINKFLQSTLYGGAWNHPKGYDKYLARAAELLGEDHYLYGNLKGKEYFFKARDLFLDYKSQKGVMDSAILEHFIKYLQQGLDYDDKAPYLYHHLTYGAGLTYDVVTNRENIEYLKKAIELAPSWIRPHWMIGLFYRCMDEFSLAKRWIEKAEILDVDKKDPYLPSLKWLTLNFLGARQEFIEAQHLHQNSIKNEHDRGCPLHHYYYLNHQFEESKKIGKQHVAFENQRQFSDTIWKAHCSWYYGDPTKAETILLEYIKKIEASENPLAKSNLDKTTGPYGPLVAINLAQGDIEEAEYWYSKKGEIERFGSPALINGWGYGLDVWLAYAKGNFEKVDSLVQKRAKEMPQALLIENMLMLLTVADELDYVIYIFEKAKVNFANNTHLHYHLGRLYLEQKNDLKKAIENLDACLVLDENHTYAWYYLAVAHARNNDTKAALNCLEVALKNGYDYPEKLKTEPALERLRKTKRYKRLEGKYFRD